MPFFLFLAFRLGAVFFDMRPHSLDGDAEEVIRFCLHSILNMLVCRVQFSPVGFVEIFSHMASTNAEVYLETWLFQFGCRL